MAVSVVTDLRPGAIRLRRATPADAERAAPVIFSAFREVAERHGFAPGFSSVEVAARVAALFIGLPAFHNIVAETVEAGGTDEGRVVGIIFLDEGDPVRGVAIVAVDPVGQGRGVGRQLMTAALERAHGARSVRLVQEAFNVHALGLYASLGFEVVEPLVRVVGRPRQDLRPGVEVKRLQPADLEACGALYREICGFDRSVDLADGFRLFAPFGVVRDGRITACTYVVFDGHLAWGVAETDADMHALLSGTAAALATPLNFNVPTRRAAFLRWCLAEGLRIEKPLTLMAKGEHQDPRGLYLPSGIY